MKGGACPKCKANALQFDELYGITACEACGHVQEEAVLVHCTPETLDGPSGVFVPDKDSGRAAAASLLPRQGVGLWLQRSSSDAGQDTRVKRRLRCEEVCHLLHLQPAIVSQAQHFQEQLAGCLERRWRRDCMVAAAVYAACRIEGLPLTLRDLADAIQESDVHLLGRHYQAALQLLGLRPPLAEPEILLRRSLDRIARAMGHGTPTNPGQASPPLAVAWAGVALDTRSLAQVQPDAELLLRWMKVQLGCQCHPQAEVGAAVVVAAQMATLPGVETQVVAVALGLAKGTVDRRAQQVRQKLLELSRLLPYGAEVTSRNVGTHARTIIRLSGVLVAAAGNSPAPASPCGAASAEAATPEGTGKSSRAAAAAASGTGAERQATAVAAGPAGNAGEPAGMVAFAQDDTAQRRVGEVEEEQQVGAISMYNSCANLLAI
ncbi:hypothetical protein N2152v2_007876 [Parachlorella kessleri]